MIVKLQNSLSDLAKLHEAVEAFSRRNSIEEGTAFKIDLALEEIFTNIVRHGCGDQQAHLIVIHFQIKSGCIHIRIEDDCREFNPLLAPPPDVNLPLEKRRPGGLGIHLVRTLMDRVDYRRSNGRNVLLLSKKILATRSEADGNL